MMIKDLVIASAARNPQALAVKGPDGSLTYGQLDQLANQIGRALSRLGVTAGDRVAIWLEKSTRTVAAMQAVLRLGAVYVPIDPLSPVARAQTIMQNCAVRAVVTSERRAASLADLPDDVAFLCVDGPGRGISWDEVTAGDASALPELPHDPHSMAYILYTSGSTGTPKGVCISQTNALAFVTWAAEEIAATETDRLSNHAPFHFDLSVLDLYVAFLAGAAVVLLADELSYVPRRLVDFIMEERITVWYSVPSALILMLEQGGLLDIDTLPLRVVLFAGEPFPMKPLRRLYERWAGLRWLNLYGPTETNVCTFYEVTQKDMERSKPVPIGKACSGDRAWAVKEDGSTAGVGEEGELLVSGPTVMLGYWGRLRSGDEPYATGDLVVLQEDGSYTYQGRRDHMVKVRGHRVELGEIEAALGAHPAVRDVAVAITGVGMAARLVAVVVSDTPQALHLLEVKRHCAERLPRYMIVDDVRFSDALPRTRNGKIDRLQLARDLDPAPA